MLLVLSLWSTFLTFVRRISVLHTYCLIGFQCFSGLHVLIVLPCWIKVRTLSKSVSLENYQPHTGFCQSNYVFAESIPPSVLSKNPYRCMFDLLKFFKWFFSTHTYCFIGFQCFSGVHVLMVLPCWLKLRTLSKSVSLRNYVLTLVFINQITHLLKLSHPLFKAKNPYRCMFDSLKYLQWFFSTL